MHLMKLERPNGGQKDNGMITIKQNGNFNKTEQYLKKMSSLDLHSMLVRYGMEGVSLLSEATPKDTGLTASSWGYIIESKGPRTTLTWINNNVNDKVVVAVIIQYGHATRGGTYVQGIDYINPVMKPLFEKMVANLCTEVASI